MSSANGQRRQIRPEEVPMEVNEVKQRRRLDHILDNVFENVETKISEAWTYYVNGKISATARDITTQEAVKRAIREAYNLLVDHADEGDGRDDYWQGDPNNPIGRIPMEYSDDIIIIGLRDFLRTDEIYHERWQEPETRRGMPDKTVTRTAETAVPKDVSVAAYLRLKKFLSKEHDLEIQFESIERDTEAEPW